MTSCTGNCSKGRQCDCVPDVAISEAPVQVVKLPLFADSPIASAAIGIALALALVFVLWLIGSGQ